MNELRLDNYFRQFNRTRNSGNQIKTNQNKTKQKKREVCQTEKKKLFYGKDR